MGNIGHLSSSFYLTFFIIFPFMASSRFVPLLLSTLLLNGNESTGMSWDAPLHTEMGIYISLCMWVYDSIPVINARMF